jgi:NDP-sugar pyrophosphorylase family protein
MIDRNTKILILAGGKGKRFNPFSFVIPKPLMPINQNPILMYSINSFKKYNFKNFFISTGYQAELIKAYLGVGKKLGVKVKYFNENKPLGTAGPISKIKKEIKINDYFFLINGDVYTEMNYKKMMTFAKKNNYDLLVGSIKKKYKNSFGVLDIKNDKIKNITEKPNSSFNISSGIYIIKNTKNLNLIPKNKFFTMPNLIKKYISKGLNVGSYNIKEYWMGIENIDNLKKVGARLNKKSV